MKLLYILFILLIVWSVWGYFSSKVEQADYSVVDKKDGYEIRFYPAHIVAQTEVKGLYGQALNRGFAIVAAYIFGDNSKKEGVAMTAPVVAEKKSYEKIAMTAPVLASKSEDSTVVSFGMPKTYTLETLPVPNDSRVRLVEIPAKKMAAIKFSGYRSDNLLKNMEEKLKTLLIRDNVKMIGDFSYAGYNAPWTPPWMTKNEVLVEIN